MKIARNNTKPFIPTLNDMQPGQCFVDKNDDNGKEIVCMMPDYNSAQSSNFKSFVDLETGMLLSAGGGREVKPCNCKVVVEG